MSFAEYLVILHYNINIMVNYGYLQFTENMRLRKKRKNRKKNHIFKTADSVTAACLLYYSLSLCHCSNKRVGRLEYIVILSLYYHCITPPHNTNTVITVPLTLLSSLPLTGARNETLSSVLLDCVLKSGASAKEFCVQP